MPAQWIAEKLSKAGKIFRQGSYVEAKRSGALPPFGPISS